MGKLNTAGYEGWWPMRIATAKTGPGEFASKEVFRNMATGEVHEPENGWNGEPPSPTGDLAHVRHGMGGDEEFWANMAAAKDQTKGTVVLQEPGRTIIRYGGH